MVKSRILNINLVLITWKFKQITEVFWYIRMIVDCFMQISIAIYIQVGPHQSWTLKFSCSHFKILASYRSGAHIKVGPKIYNQSQFFKILVNLTKVCWRCLKMTSTLCTLLPLDLNVGSCRKLILWPMIYLENIFKWLRTGLRCLFGLVEVFIPLSCRFDLFRYVSLLCI